MLFTCSSALHRPLRATPGGLAAEGCAALRRPAPLLPPSQIILSFGLIYLGGLIGLTASAKWETPAAGEAATSGQMALFWVM